MTATTRLKKNKKADAKKAKAKKAQTKKKADAKKTQARKKTQAKKKAKAKKAQVATKRAGATRSTKDRFEARRLAAERREGMKRLRLVLGLAVVSTMAIATIGFLNSAWFDVDEIIVTGSQRSDPELIIESSGIELGQALLEVDQAGATDAVQLVPWVGTVEVDRQLSGTITITVTERGPSAVLSAGNQFALIDDHGRQLEVVNSRPDGFMPVSGIEASGIPGEPAPAEALPLITMLEALPPEIEQQISAVVIEDGELLLELAIGGQANFGDGTELGLKLQSLETMLASVDLSCLNTIDLRVPASPALTRTQPRAGSAASSEGVSGGVTAESNGSQEPDSGLSDC